jgi:PPK2 family polyphosphate:nucleotide phosphotransferase
MASFKKYRVGSKFKLSHVDPGDTAFCEGDEAAQREAVDAMAVELDEQQNLLHAEGRRKVLLVLQGMDTSGKDGTVRWVFSRTSPLGVRVAAFKAPSEEERARDYLWRCHAVVPRTGEIAVWNRSHYEDVLVPVVNGWITPQQARQRHAHINDFERMLAETGTVVLKFMLHISKDEQRARLQERLDDPTKNWKFAPEDLTVRKQWKAYQQAYADAIAATGTRWAPWTVVPADSKTHRNLMIATLVKRALVGLKLRYPPAADDLAKLRIR